MLFRWHGQDSPWAAGAYKCTLPDGHEGDHRFPMSVPMQVAPDWGRGATDATVKAERDELLNLLAEMVNDFSRHGHPSPPSNHPAVRASRK